MKSTCWIWPTKIRRCFTALDFWTAWPSLPPSRMSGNNGEVPYGTHCILKLILLPLLLAVLLLQWAMTFAIRISAWVFDLAAGLIALICVASSLLGLFPWADQVPQLLLALALFLVPYLATWLTMRLISLRFFLQSKVFA